MGVAVLNKLPMDVLLLVLLRGMLVDCETGVTIGETKIEVPAQRKVTVEVTSCDDVTIIMKGGDTERISYKLELSTMDSLTMKYSLWYCLYDSKCQYFMRAFAQTNVTLCSGFYRTWFHFSKDRKLYIGQGCEIEREQLLQLDVTIALYPLRLLLTSNGKATWKFGPSACQPDTTTTPTTSTTTTTTVATTTSTSAAVTMIIATSPPSAASIETSTTESEFATKSSEHPTTRPHSLSPRAALHVMMWGVTLCVLVFR